MTQYRYHSDKPEFPHGYLRQEPMMEKPQLFSTKYWAFKGTEPDHDKFEGDMAIYDKHLQSLPTIICSAGKWEERVYGEEEIVIGYEWKPIPSAHAWTSCVKEFYDKITDARKRLVASLKEKGEDVFRPMKAFGYELMFISNPMMKEGQVMASPELLDKLKEVFKHLPATPTASGERMFSEEDKDNFAISFACWAMYDPQAKLYQQSGITAADLLEKYKDRPYLSPNIENN